MKHESGVYESFTLPDTLQGVCIFDEHRKALFTGDSVSGTERGEIRPFRRGDSHDYDSELRYESVCAISHLRYNIILPFHYSPVLEDADSKLRNYLATSG